MAYRFEYADGLRVAMLLMEGLVHDITVAARLENQRDPLSLLFYLGSGHAIQPNSSSTHFAATLEHMIATDQQPYPVERTLLTIG